MMQYMKESGGRRILYEQLHTPPQCTLPFLQLILDVLGPLDYDSDWVKSQTFIVSNPVPRIDNASYFYL